MAVNKGATSPGEGQDGPEAPESAPGDVGPLLPPAPPGEAFPTQGGPLKGGGLPPELVQAFTATPDIYALYGRSQAEVARLNSILGATLGYLEELRAKLLPAIQNEDPPG